MTPARLALLVTLVGAVVYVWTAFPLLLLLGVWLYGYVAGHRDSVASAARRVAS